VIGSFIFERRVIMSMKEWAKNEVKLACEREKKAAIETEGDATASEYGVACYKSALRAFNSLCKDEHSGYSIRLTRAILDRLIDGRPLTPIEDIPEVWNEVYFDRKNKVKRYQCKRMSSLFKYVDKIGNVKYSDTERVWCMDRSNPDVSYSSGLTKRIIDEMFPIEMPYSGETKYKVICEDCLVDPVNGDFDTVGIFEVRISGPGTDEVVKINRYFREPEKGEKETYPGWVEISRTTYNRRKKESRRENQG